MSPLRIYWHHLNRPNLLARSVYKFYLYFYVRIILHCVGFFCFLPWEACFSKVKNYYFKSAYYSTCDDCCASADEVVMKGVSFIQLNMLILVLGEKLHEVSRKPYPVENRSV